MAYAWIIWLILAAIFIGAEVLTPSFFLFWFGIGALVAALMALIGIGSLPAQIIVFLIVSSLLVVASRTILERFFGRRSDGTHLRTGVEKMLGQVGTVVEPSRGALHEAAVKVYGSVWTAIPTEGEEPLREGETVSVERIEGNTIYVRRTTRGRALLFSETSEHV